MILSAQYNFKQNKRLAYEMTTHKRCNNIYKERHWNLKRETMFYLHYTVLLYQWKQL